jgi:hypothetical protein
MIRRPMGAAIMRHAVSQLNAAQESPCGVPVLPRASLTSPFDLADPSQLPVIDEPHYLQAKARITVSPCLALEDIKKGVEEAARRMPATQG